MFCIKADILYTGRSVLKNKYIIVEGNKIKEITDEKPDCEVIAEGIVTPAFIDAHSHIGMYRYGEPYYEEETNDITDQFLVTPNPLDSIYFDDKAFEEAVEFGVLYSCVVPGSGNLMGGRAIVIRNFAKNRDEALVKDYGYKMALGYNPRSTQDWKGIRPNTRMVLYDLLIRKFKNVLRKKKKLELEKRKHEKELKRKLEKGEITKEEYDEELNYLEEKYKLEFDDVELAILELLDRKKVAKVHVHKEDDVLFLIEFVKMFGIKATADHLCDVHHVEIFKKVGEVCPIVYGPIDALPYKVELKHESYKNVKLLVESGAFFGLMTDHPVVLARDLFIQAGKHFRRYLGKEGVIELVTYRNAKILEIDDILGTVEPGKLASLLVWEEDPFILGSKPSIIIAEGKIIKNE